MGTDARANAKRAMQELFGGRVEELNERDGMEEAYAPVSEEGIEDRPNIWEAMSSAPKSVGATVIDSDTVITGTIKSNSDMEVHGTVYGDIDCTKDVHFYGRIAGNIACTNFYQYSGAVKGDVTASAAVGIEKSAAVKGDVKANAAQINGRLAGNISAQTSVDLLNDAIVAGDIETHSFSMKDTAKLQGAVRLLCDSKSLDEAFNGYFDF